MLLLLIPHNYEKLVRGYDGYEVGGIVEYEGYIWTIEKVRCKTCGHYAWSWSSAGVNDTANPYVTKEIVSVTDHRLGKALVNDAPPGLDEGDCI